MSMSRTPFTHEQLVAISQDLSQAIHDDPALIALFMGQAPPTTPRTAPTLVPQEILGPTLLVIAGTLALR